MAHIDGNVRIVLTYNAATRSLEVDGLPDEVAIALGLFELAKISIIESRAANRPLTVPPLRVPKIGL